jgi:aromatic-L-amino-acid decarboxylase
LIYGQGVGKIRKAFMKKSDLELSPETMRRMGEAAVEAVVEHIKNLPDSPRSNLERGEEISRALREPSPEEGTDFSELLDFLMKEVIPVSINAPHPTYMAYIPGGGLYPSALADLVASATNRYVGIWEAAPAGARLETNVLEWFADWMDYPAEAKGILTTGGSLANFSAVVTARRHLLGDDLTKGTVYASNQTHHCLMKAAMLAGIPERNVRLLDVDSNFRAVPELFEDAIAADTAKGFQPFFLVSNAGTTNTGAVDPMSDLAAVARKHNLWHHVDGAYGGFFRLCSRGKKKLEGIDASDSIVLDPHKGLFIPYGSGSLLVREGELLRKAHMMTGDYLQDLATPTGEVNASDYSPELTRSFRGLRIWLPLKLYGIRAFRENLEEKLELADWLYRKFLDEPGFECLAVPDLTVIAFLYRPAGADDSQTDFFNRKLLEKINRSKELFLSSTLLRGRFVIRVCVLSFRTHLSEAGQAFEVIVDKARELEKELYG